jgi:hypothetical protein
MIKFISFDSSELGSKFNENKSISSISVLMTKKKRMSDVNGIGIHSGYRENNINGRDVG